MQGPRAVLVLGPTVSPREWAKAVPCRPGGPPVVAPLALTCCQEVMAGASWGEQCVHNCWGLPLQWWSGPTLVAALGHLGTA